MPITPVHLGPSLGLSLLFRRYLDVVVFFFASLLIDLEPVVLFLLGSTVVFYFSHTFLFGGLIGVLVAYAIHFFRSISFDWWHYLYPGLNWQPGREVSRLKLLLSGIFGVWSHILLDSFASPGIRPFHPFFMANPFRGMLTQGQVYLISLIFFFIALFIGFKVMVKRTAQKGRGAGDEGFNVV